MIITERIIFFTAEDLSSEDNSLTNLNDLYDEYFKSSQKLTVSLSNLFHGITFRCFEIGDRPGYSELDIVINW